MPQDPEDIPETEAKLPRGSRLRRTVGLLVVSLSLVSGAAAIAATSASAASSSTGMATVQESSSESSTSQAQEEEGQSNSERNCPNKDQAGESA